MRLNGVILIQAIALEAMLVNLQYNISIYSTTTVIDWDCYTKHSNEMLQYNSVQYTVHVWISNNDINF